jgi:hypothetical protein
LKGNYLIILNGWSKRKTFDYPLKFSSAEKKGKHHKFEKISALCKRQTEENRELAKTEPVL